MSWVSHTGPSGQTNNPAANAAMLNECAGACFAGANKGLTNQQVAAQVDQLAGIGSQQRGR